MMKAAEYAREHGVPFFGICYGFQWATVEYARNVCGLEGADSTEVDENAPHKVIYKLRDLLGVDDLGGTMRLGRYACELAPARWRERIYGTSLVHERHRHRFEFNCLYEPALTERACAFPAARPTASSSRSPSCRRIRGSWPCSSTRSSSRSRCRPHPLFASFVEAALPAQDRAALRSRSASQSGRAMQAVR